MTSLLWLKEGFIFWSISAKYKYVVYAQKIQVDKGIFRFLLGKSATDQMRYRIYLIAVHDRSTDTYSTGPLPYFNFIERAVCLRSNMLSLR